jgi:hypothetical protein
VHGRTDACHERSVELHVTPGMGAGRQASGAPVSAGMRAAVGGAGAGKGEAGKGEVRANNYSPLPASPLLPLRPTAAPRRAGHTPPTSSGGASGRASLRAASARASARAAGGGPDAHAIQRPSPVSPRTTRSMRAPAPSDRAGRAHDGTPAEGGEALDDDHVARREHLPQHVRNSDHPIGELMEATIEARDADPPRQRVERAHHRRRPFVMTANIRSGDDGNRQDLGVGDLRPPSPPPARGGVRGGCDALGVPSTGQSRQKRRGSGERPSAPPGDDGGSATARAGGVRTSGRQRAIKVFLMFMMPALPGRARTRVVPPPQEMLALPCWITSRYAGKTPALSEGDQKTGFVVS